MNESITKNIQSLQYDPDVVLAFNGEKIGNVVPAEDQLENGTYIVVKHEKKTATQKNFDIAIVNAINDRTYPGALLLGNKDLVNNTPSTLYGKRAPLTLRVNLPGLEDEGSARIENPSYSTVSETINGILTTWIRKFSSTHKISAIYNYTESEVHSKDHLRVIVGFDLASKLNLDFDFKSTYNNEKRMFVLTFKQIFYTVSIDTPEQPGDFFAEDEKWENLVANGVDKDNPPVYVANVAYGRTIYLVMTTNNSDLELEAKVKGIIKDNKFNAEALYNTVFDNAEFSVVVLGGSSDEHINMITKDRNKIKEIIENNSSFSEANQGAPISYTTAFLKENQIAAINSSTEYVESTSTRYTRGRLILKHTGGYIAKFNATWKERRYNEKGEAVDTSQQWSKNGNKLTAPFSTEINLPANTIDLHVTATEKTGLVWEPWRTVLDRDLDLAPEITVSIGGTTLSPKGSVTYGES